MKKILLITVAGQLCCAGLAIAAPNYVAHEWGTFTSVQGADGVQLAWNPLSVSELPTFVYDWAKAGPSSLREARIAAVGKSVSMCLQRMETPVIYFYSDDEMTVSAKVDFPMGSITEWYPQAKLPGTLVRNALGPRTLEWSGIKISPVQQKATVPSSLLQEKSGSHYYAARETDADLVSVNNETEKFLFYRGVGNFRAPLTVTQSGDTGDAIALENTAPEPLRQLFVYQRKGDLARFVFVPSMEASGRLEIAMGSSVPFEPGANIRKKLGSELESALTREGLYEREARAMVKTWDDSWFAEQGLRVFYALPAPWTDRVLPLSLEPKPAETVRVMVGRAELITPQMENDLKREIVRYGNGTPEEKANAVSAARALGLGRFMEPTVRRLTQRIQNKSFATHSAELLNAATKPEPAGKKLAAK